MPPRSGIVFDMDGLLLDTERVARIAWQQAAREANYDMSEELFASLIGRREADSIELLRVAFGPEFDFHKSNARCNAIYEDYVTRHGVPVKTGAREILEALSDRKIPLALATSTQSPLAQRRLEQAGLLHYFADIVTGNQVTHGKPAPDIYLEAIRRIGIDAATSFALEDSQPGVRSAHGAGLQVIMVPDLVPPTPEITALTHAIVNSLHEARELLLRTSPGY